MFVHCEAKNDSDVNPDFDELSQEYTTRKEVPVDENGVVQNPIYIGDNGVTVKARDWAFVGDSGILNDVEYIIIMISWKKISFLVNCTQVI